MQSQPPYLDYKSPAVQPGVGVARTIMDAPRAEEPKEGRSTYVDHSGREYLLDSLGQREWSETPVFEGQYSDARLCKRDAPTAVTFDLSEPDQLKAYNDLLAKLDPNGPGVEIIAEDRQFYRGKFVVFVIYTKVWYLLPTRK